MNYKISDLPLDITPPVSGEIELNNSGISERTSITNILAPITLAYQNADSVLTSTTATLNSTKANLVSPTFIGIPAGPTAAANTNTTQFATTAYAYAADNLRLLVTGGNSMAGILNMGANKISGLSTGTSDSDATTLLQMKTADALHASILENYDPTGTSAFPTTWNSLTILKGARFYITAAGTMNTGAVVVQIGDIIEARANNPADSATVWSVIQVNDLQATTTVIGNTAYATDIEAKAEASTTKALTPSNLAAMGSTTAQTGI